MAPSTGTGDTFIVFCILVLKKLSPLLTRLLTRNLSALFPAGMPPVEKLHNPLASSRLTLHAYEDVSIPRTEL